MVRNVIEGKFDEACSGLKQLYDLGYSPTDIITTLFRIIKNYDMAEFLKLEFMKVTATLLQYLKKLTKPRFKTILMKLIYEIPLEHRNMGSF